MLAEGVEIMRQAWTAGVRTLAGEHYQVERRHLVGRSRCRRAASRCGSPVVARRKTLRIAAEHAAYTNFDGTPETFSRKSAVLAEHCRDIGRDVGEIVRSANYKRADRPGRTPRSPSDCGPSRSAPGPTCRPKQLADLVGLLGSGPLVGTAGADRGTPAGARGDRHDLRITYFAEAAYDRSGIDLFTSEVIPALAG